MKKGIKQHWVIVITIAFFVSFTMSSCAGALMGTALGADNTAQGLDNSQYRK